VVKKMIKKILIISSIVIALTLTGCSPSGVLRPVTSPSLAATNTTDIKIKDENSNNQTAEVKVEEADGEVEAVENAIEQGPAEDNLPNGGHQDNTDVEDHQFEGVE
jgi:peptidoglycan hydrolase CwlO-like protein